MFWDYLFYGGCVYGVFLYSFFFFAFFFSPFDHLPEYYSGIQARTARMRIGLEATKCTSRVEIGFSKNSFSKLSRMLYHLICSQPLPNLFELSIDFSHCTVGVIRVQVQSVQFL